MRICFKDFRGNSIGYETPEPDTPLLGIFPHLSSVLRKRYNRTGNLVYVLNIAEAWVVDGPDMDVMYRYSELEVSLSVLNVLHIIRTEEQAALTIQVGSFSLFYACHVAPQPNAETRDTILALRRYFQHLGRAVSAALPPSVEQQLLRTGCGCHLLNENNEVEIIHITSRSVAALMDVHLSNAQVMNVLDSEYAPPLENTQELPEVPDFTANTRRFGIEFEFVARPSLDSVWDEYSKELNRTFDNVRVTDYEHSDGTCWHLKPDSSCGFELASPALTWDMWEEVEDAAGILCRLGAQTTQTCGLHVHHDLSDFSVVQLRRLVVLWATFEDVIFGLVHSQRANNRYCMPLKTSLNYQTWDSLIEPLTDVMRFQGFVQHEFGRYRALNCTGWWNHGRVEMRLLEGTLDINLVKFWVFITQRFVEIARNYNDYAALSKAYNARGVDELENMLVQLLEMDLTEDQREVFRSLWKIRYKKFNLLTTAEFVR